VPIYYAHKPSGGRSNWKGDYVDGPHQPLWPFGFGLSYTTFQIFDVQVHVNGSVADDDLVVEVTATVANTGPVAGAEVVQVYVGDLESTVARPVRELKGFTKVALEPGESTPVSIVLGERAFAFWSTQLGRWAVEAGDFTISVGSSSRDLVATETLRLDAPSLALPLGPDSTLHEWLADERGRALLLAQKPTPKILEDPELVRIIGTMPMDTLAAFGGMGFDHASLQSLINQLQSANSER
jgi:beta-glucosidase